MHLQSGVSLIIFQRQQADKSVIPLWNKNQDEYKFITKMIKEEGKPMRKNIVLVLFAVVALMVYTGVAMGQAASDDAIKAQINKGIQANPALSIGNVNVDVKNGDVTLSGKVANKQSERQIVDIAQKTPGVKSVKSNLEVYQQR